MKNFSYRVLDEGKFFGDTEGWDQVMREAVQQEKRPFVCDHCGYEYPIVGGDYAGVAKLYPGLGSLCWTCHGRVHRMERLAKLVTLEEAHRRLVRFLSRLAMPIVGAYNRCKGAR